jgi:Fe-S-cluster-containing dehydrogenase component/formate-dependent nitrite reductase membrane component NrfD
LQLGFVIDHSRCIGCHACTVACKAENDVPLGSFRTWVKYTERGTFPEVRRSFAVLRCNQCTDAPCVTICPVRALDKRPDGIVDIDPAVCIGCKACMQGCPYDALYIHPQKGIAEKCHFCAHRTEVGLAPACAVVCPTEAIVPGDFHDPESAVSRLRKEHDLSARKTEAGTGPNVLYRDVSADGIDPSLTDAAGGYLWANRLPGAALDAEAFEAAEREAEQRARTTYDVDHPRHWGARVSAYLLTKSLAAGLFLVLPLLVATGSPALGRPAPGPLLALAAGALFFLLVTTVLLVLDLKRPERFLTILTRPNWGSWLARGSWVLIGFSGVLVIWCARLLLGDAAATRDVLAVGLLGAGSVLAALTAAYTGWLFAQARGRVLWMRRGLWLHLIVQAFVAGAALTLMIGAVIGLSRGELFRVRDALLPALLLHVLFVSTEGWMAPAKRGVEYRRAHRLVTRGPFAALHWQVGLGVGVLLPMMLLATPLPALWPWAGLLVLVGLWVEEDILVRAGQAPAIS